MSELMQVNNETAPSDEEVAQAAEVLSRIQPGFLPKPLFEQVTRICTTPIVEVVPLRKSPNGETEVLLLSRPDDDPVWPGMLHTPGTVIRATDADRGMESAFQRIFSGELQVDQPIEPVFVSMLLHPVKRGTEFAAVHYADMNGIEVAEGQWYQADNLPDSIVDTQVGFIQASVAAFEGGR